MTRTSNENESRSRPMAVLTAARRHVGLVILGIAFLWSTIWVAYSALTVAGEKTLEGKRILRFAHWQLEGKTREAIDDAIALYEELHPDVEVRQIPIPAQSYKQWLRTQMIGRTAPDLMEIYSPGNPIWDSLVVRYFQPITRYVEQPNPYNTKQTGLKLAKMIYEAEKAAYRERLEENPDATVPASLRLYARTEKGEIRFRHPADPGVLEGVPWRDTYVDNMQGGYYSSLQDYYGMPQSVFTTRVFVNKDMVMDLAPEITEGPDGEFRPPKDLKAFFKMCRLIRDRSRANKNYGQVLPVAGSDEVTRQFADVYWQIATFSLLDAIDRNGDGDGSEGERLLALASGAVDLETDPNVEGYHALMYELSRYFNPGFINAKRDDSIFMFVQKNAAMIATGSWEAGSLKANARFDVEAFDFPVPSPGDRYSDVIRFRRSETGQVGFPMAISKFCSDPDLAVDFMQFLTSRRINEWLNLRFSWFPAIRGSEVVEDLKPFEPDLEGVYRVIQPWVGGSTKLEYDQGFQDFMSANPAERVRGLEPSDPAFQRWLRQDHYREFIEDYAGDVTKHGLDDFKSTLEDKYSRATSTENQLAGARARAIHLKWTPAVRQHLTSLIFGQTKHIGARAAGWQQYRQSKELWPGRKKRGGGGS